MIVRTQPVLKATRYRIHKQDFSLYQIELPVATGFRVVDDRGNPTSLPPNFNGIIGVHEQTYVGAARGVTGKHSLNADNTKCIFVKSLKVMPDGHIFANAWVLTNQEEVDALYRQRRLETHPKKKKGLGHDESSPQSNG